MPAEKNLNLQDFLLDIVAAHHIISIINAAVLCVRFQDSGGIVVKAEEIKRLRESFGMTQEDFAHELGVTFATVNRWENHKAVPSRLAVKVLDQLKEKAQRQGLAK